MNYYLAHQEATKVGQIADLMSGTERYRNISISELLRTVVPPLRAGQYVMMWNDRGALTGFASWALFSPEVERVFRNRERKLQPSDWTSGRIMWVLDFVAPGHALELTKLVQFTISMRYPFVKVGKFRRGTFDGKTRREGYVHRLRKEAHHASV